MKTKNPVTFRIKRSKRTKQFRCVVVAGNSEPTFVGESCKNAADVDDTILSHIEAIREGRFEVVDEKGTKWIFAHGPVAPNKLAKKCCGKGCKKPKHYEGKSPRGNRWP